MKIIRVVLIVSMLGVFPNLTHAQNGLFFTFKSGFPVSGTSIGLKLGPLAPYGGLDIVRISATFEDQSTSWHAVHLGYNDDLGRYEYGELLKDSERESTLDGSATLIMPHAGVKFHLSRFYLLGDIMLVIPSVDGRDKGSRIEYYYDDDGNLLDTEFDSWDNKLEKEDKKRINDALDFVMLTAGFGAEYALSPQFSVGGEYGLRLILNNIEDSGEDISETDDGQAHWKDAWEDKIAMSLGITYTAFTLNFYF